MLCLSSDISVFLTHGPTTVESTIKSPEIQKLLPFTGNELRLAATENKPLTSQVEAALEKKHVICFMKYYNQDHRGSIVRRCYPLVKIYTEAEVHEYEVAQQATALAEALSEEVAPVGNIGSSLSTAMTVPEKQLFTPSIKPTLEKVEGLSTTTSTSKHDEIRSKRMLTFEEPITGEATYPPTNQNPHASSPPAATFPPHQQQLNDPPEATRTKKSKSQNKKA